jgi:Multicopper oxidase
LIEARTIPNPDLDFQARFPDKPPSGTDIEYGIAPSCRGQPLFPASKKSVAAGSTRDIEFFANNPGDWPFHCHMTHHVMNQMGHQFPNMIGVKPGDVNKQAGRFLSGFMTMGETGMADRGAMGMKIPKNSVPMVGLQTPKDYITMGGMYTNLKVRENLESYDKDPGWYEDPAGTLASLASNDEMQRDLGFIPSAEKNGKPVDHLNMKHGA